MQPRSSLYQGSKEVHTGRPQKLPLAGSITRRPIWMAFRFELLCLFSMPVDIVLLINLLHLPHPRVALPLPACPVLVTDGGVEKPARRSASERQRWR